jgi:hypothetical protein
MKTEILNDLAKGSWDAKLRHLVFIRVIKFITVCLILNLLFLLVLLEDYTSLFFLLGAVSGFLIFMALRFLENRFSREHFKKEPEVNSGQLKLTDLEQIRKNPVPKK